MNTDNMKDLAVVRFDKAKSSFPMQKVFWKGIHSARQIIGLSTRQRKPSRQCLHQSGRMQGLITE